MATRRYEPDDLNVDKNLLESNPIKGELNIESLVFRQIERTYQSALQDETLFASNVRLLLSSVPTNKRLEILEQTDEYTSTNQTYQYKYWCGVPLGTPHHPVNGSPAVIEEENIDWHKLFEIILAALEECGLTWKFDRWTIEVGAVEKDKPSPTPTPVFDNPFINTPPSEPGSTIPSQATPQKNAHPCAICNQPVSGKGTAQFYKHKRVHIKECLDIAKAKWADVDD